MGRFIDKRGVTWDIRTTDTTTGGATTSKWVAAIADDSDSEYTGRFHTELDDDEAFAGKPDIKITWPMGGNPILRGPGKEDVAKASIDAFAQRDAARPQGQQNVVIRITGKVPRDGASSGGEGVALLAIVALLLLADKKR